ncbi:hypothetical protein [Micromonospora pisi]|nr:hypothetical protein [Micromonospora pisi]
MTSPVSPSPSADDLTEKGDPPPSAALEVRGVLTAVALVCLIALITAALR